MTIHVDYYGPQDVFLIRLPYHRNDAIRELPSRRYNKTKGVWVVGGTRMNARFLEEEVIGLDDAVVTRAAAKAISVAVDFKLPVSGGWPSDYHYKLPPMKHQELALKKLFPYRIGALFFDMGTGKTKAAIDFCTGAFQYGEIQIAIVLCMNGTKDLVWGVQIPEHAPDKLLGAVHVLQPLQAGRNRFERWRDNQLAVSKLNWLIVGHEALSQGHAPGMLLELVRKYKCGIVVDEASAFFNLKSNRSQNLLAMGAEVGLRLVLTGTPIANSNLDLFSLFYFLDRRIIGCDNSFIFKAHFCEMGGYQGKQIEGYKNVEELMALVEPYSYTVEKADVLDLPPKMPPENRLLDMPAKQGKAYHDLRKHYEAQYELEREQGIVDVTGTTVLERYLRLHEIAGGFLSVEAETPQRGEGKRGRRTFEKHWISDAKVDELMAVLKEAGKQQVVIWCQFRMEIERIAQRLAKTFPGEAIGQLHGGIDDDVRFDTVRNQFQKGRMRFLIASPKVAAMGLEMFASRLAVYFSNSFSLIDRLQSEDRIHRKGQTKQVHYVDLTMRGTVDELVLRSLQNKQDFAQYVRHRMKEGHNPFATLD